MQMVEEEGLWRNEVSVSGTLFVCQRGGGGTLYVGFRREDVQFYGDE